MTAAPSTFAQQPAPTQSQQPPSAQPATPSTSPQNAAEPTRNADGTFTIRRNARIVILDMVVTDAKGAVITDLKRDDFRVTEMNEPQTILNFEAAGAHSVTPDESIDSTNALDTLAPTRSGKHHPAG